MEPGYSLWIFPILIGLLAGVALADAELGWPKAIPNGFGTGCPTPNPKELDMFVEAGLRVARRDFQWEDVEREKGKYDFSKDGLQDYDALTEAWTSHGIRPLYILDYSNRLYESGQSVVTEEGRKAFAAWASAAAKRYTGKGIIWEIWNEPNVIHFWKPQNPPKSIEEYCKLVAAVAPEIKKADPTAKVVGPSCASVHPIFRDKGHPPDSWLALHWLEQSFKYGLLDYVDGVSVHLHRFTPPESVVPECERLRELIKRYAPAGKQIPIISTEWGYSCCAPQPLPPYTDRPILSQEQQAAYLIRMLLIHQWQGVPVTIWFDWKNWEDNWMISDCNVGIVTHDLKPKTAYIALKVLSETLNGFEFDSKVDLPGKDVYVLAFRKDGQRAYAIWTMGEPREITLPLGAGKGTLISMYGERGEVSWTDEGLKVMTKGTPLYLILP